MLLLPRAYHPDRQKHPGQDTQCFVDNDNTPTNDNNGISQCQAPIAASSKAAVQQHYSLLCCLQHMTGSRCWWNKQD